MHVYLVNLGVCIRQLDSNKMNATVFCFPFFFLDDLVLENNRDMQPIRNHITLIASAIEQ